jgi:hypothetical protein
MPPAERRGRQEEGKPEDGEHAPEDDSDFDPERYELDREAELEWEDAEATEPAD